MGLKKTSQFFFIKFLSFFILLNIFSSCAHYDQNLVKYSQDSFKGGRLGDMEWKDELLMYRYSWYSGATMIYEVNTIPIANESPFMSWFDESEKSVVKNCQQLLFAETYIYDSKKANGKIFDDALLKLGFREISAPYFIKSWVNHPHLRNIARNTYKQHFYCHEQNKIGNVSISLPGYKNVDLRLQ